MNVIPLRILSIKLEGYYSETLKYQRTNRWIYTIVKSHKYSKWRINPSRIVVCRFLYRKIGTKILRKGDILIADRAASKEVVGIVGTSKRKIVNILVGAICKLIRSKNKKLIRII